MSVRQRLLDERARASARLEELRAEFDAIVDASAFSAADDEHDPDGATIGFERAQVAALVTHAEQHVAELDAALARVDAGTYGRCESCGDAIAPERLDARPTARTCVACATTVR
jgi:RNA polymerase-binding transcription factor DksA